MKIIKTFTAVNKNTKLVFILLAIFLIASILSLSDTKKSQDVNNLNSEYVVDASDMISAEAPTYTVASSKLSDREIAGLLQMREEEKLARDVYTTLGNIWGVNIFSNIASSEQTHTDAIKTLLNKYAIPDPVQSNAVGIFNSKNMQELYDSLTKKGKLSLQDALIVGATIEDLDIADLENFKKDTTKQDILTTYNNLQKGSRNHLRAFVKNIQKEGATYTPAYISLELYNSIISSNQEKGMVQ